MILKEVLKAKIKKIKITRNELHYEGSIGLDAGLLKKAGLSAGDKVQVLNYDNGERLETYIIEEPAGSGAVIMYGPAARKGAPGNDICVIAYALATDDEKIVPRIVG